MNYKKPELLIPASSLEVLRTAVMFEQDAVYIGGEVFDQAKSEEFQQWKAWQRVWHFCSCAWRKSICNGLAHNRDLDGARK